MFVFGEQDEMNVVTDFNADEDVLSVSGVVGSDAFHVASSGGNTYISYGDTSIVLDGVEMDRDQVWGRISSE